MKKKTSDRSVLYYNQPKHASVRLIWAYGFFVSILTLTIVGIGFIITRSPEQSLPAELGRETGAQHPHAKIDNGSAPHSKGINDSRDKIANFEKAPETANRSHEAEPAQGGSTAPSETKREDSVIAIKPWFYDSIGAGPNATSAGSLQSEEKYTLLIKQTPRLSEAKKLRESLVKQGVHAFIQTESAKGKSTSYRIQFGVFRSKRRANEEKSRLSRDFSIDSNITKLEL